MREVGLLSLLLAVPAAAAPTIDPAFGDHAVIQRDRAVTITGTAAPGETVRVTLGDRRGSARASKDGRYRVTLPAPSATNPLTLEASASSGVARSSDLLSGDVFVCSGQSNMEMSVDRAQDGYNQIQTSADSELRLMTVDRGTAPKPRAGFAKPPVWTAATPATVAPFSAACFYMAQELRRSAKVPVGAIASSWGGTRISAWMGDAALRGAGMAAEADLLRLYARDPAAAAKGAGRRWETWWRAATGDRAGSAPWEAGTTLAWRAVPTIAAWESWGDPELASYDGMMWFRRSVAVTAAQARQAATLEIGAVDDSDQTWINGVPVGSGGNPSTARVYPLLAGTLHAGDNAIVVSANDAYGRGGMTGPAEIMRLRFADGSSVPLGSEWSYAVERRRPADAPHAPWEDVAGASVIYNAMIAPLGRVGLKGVAWYQGESDSGIPGYEDRLGAMMTDWRRAFGQPALPFAIVQLADFGTPATAPGESGFATVRDDQRRAATADGHAAVAVAVDLGDPLDIHPGEKHEVGRRLARAMRALAYGDRASASGPAIAAARSLPNGEVELRFAGVTGALATRGGAVAIGFELCGEAAGSCRFAPGRAVGDRVMLAGDGRPVARVRYAWADSPIVNLYDAAPLPAGPFEIAVSH